MQAVSPWELKTGTKDCIYVLGVDPGYRNLAWVLFRAYPKEKKVEVAAFDCVDVQPAHPLKKQEEIICAILSYLETKRDIFKVADHIIIENQMIGKHTKPLIQGTAWILGARLLRLAEWSSMEFMDARKKFKEFKKTVRLPYQKRRGMPRKLIKANSIALAMGLIAQYSIPKSMTIFQTGKESEWEHLADAAGIAFVKIIGDLFKEEK